MTLKSVFQLQGSAIHNPSDSGEDWDIVFGSPPTTTAVAKLFIAEPPGADSTYFTGGGSKDTLDLDQWQWAPVAAPDKDEITDAYAAAYFDTNGNLLLYFGADRFANTGNSTIGFWFFQDQITLNPDGTFSGLHVPGDLLIVSDFTVGGAIATIQVYQWTGNPANPLALVLSGADCGTIPPAGNLCAIVNSAATPSPWPYTPKAGPPNIFPPGSFFEGGINIGQLFGAGCFHSFLAETRASQSLTAALRDFALGSFNICSARITIAPSATNSVGSVHTFTITVEQNPGTGFVPASGVVVQGSILPGSVGSFVGGDTATTDVNGQAFLSVTSAVPGQTTVSATATVTIGSQTFTVTTDGTGQNSGPAVKRWVDGFITLIKEVEFGPITTSTDVCFTLSRTDGPLIISPSTPATQCLTFTSGNSTQTFFWDGLASGQYQITESIAPPYTPIPPIVLALDVLTQAGVTLNQENPLTDGQLQIAKLDGDGELWSSPPVTFFICQGGVPLCDSSNAAISLEVGSGNNPATLLLPEGEYTICEVPPPGYVVQSPAGTCICPPCRQVQLIAGQTTAVTFHNLRLICVVTIHCGGIRFE